MREGRFATGFASGKKGFATGKKRFATGQWLGGRPPARPLSAGPSARLPVRPAGWPHGATPLRNLSLVFLSPPPFPPPSPCLPPLRSLPSPLSPPSRLPGPSLTLPLSKVYQTCNSWSSLFSAALTDQRRPDEPAKARKSPEEPTRAHKSHLQPRGAQKSPYKPHKTGGAQICQEGPSCHYQRRSCTNSKQCTIQDSRPRAETFPTASSEHLPASRMFRELPEASRGFRGVPGNSGEMARTVPGSSGEFRGVPRESTFQSFFAFLTPPESAKHI